MDKHKTAEAMEQHGGGFAKAIAAAWFKADSQNKAKLEAAFDELFLCYSHSCWHTKPKG